MIYILLPTIDAEDSITLNKSIVGFLSKNIDKGVKVRIIKCNKHIIESTLSDIKPDDFVLWNPYLASDNIAVVKQFRNSIVLLKRQTFYLQMSNKNNPITENMAINHNFKLLYIDNEIDINNTDYSMILDESQYIFDVNKLNK